MESIFQKPRGKVDFMYVVRRHARRVEKVRVLEVAPQYVRVAANSLRKFSRRESRKSLYHEYYFHYAQAKRVLEVDYELKIAAMRAKLKTWEDELRAINDTQEQDV